MLILKKTTIFFRNFLYFQLKNAFWDRRLMSFIVSFERLFTDFERLKVRHEVNY